MSQPSSCACRQPAAPDRYVSFKGILIATAMPAGSWTALPATLPS